MKKTLISIVSALVISGNSIAGDIEKSLQDWGLTNIGKIQQFGGWEMPWYERGIGMYFLFNDIDDDGEIDLSIAYRTCNGIIDDLPYKIYDIKNKVRYPDSDLDGLYTREEATEEKYMSYGIPYCGNPV